MRFAGLVVAAVGRRRTGDVLICAGSGVAAAAAIRAITAGDQSASAGQSAENRRR
ncbi:MAG: hypothetical protein ACR2NA_02665 [Solirubrobacterales bacterium]